MVLRSRPAVVTLALALALLSLAPWLLPACGGGGGGSGGDGAPADLPPSVVLVSIDTLRADHLGTYGYERETSPFLDRFAGEAIVFERAYSTAPWTLIAHMSMLTGLEPEQHGVVGPRFALAPEVPTLAERLGRLGYQTAGLYEPGFVGPRFGFGRGFRSYVPHADAEQAEEHLRAAVERLRVDRPFFLFVHLFDVHTAPFVEGFEGFYDPPAPYDELFLAGARERLAGVPCKEVWNQARTLPPEQLEALVALYDGGIRYVDGKLEAWLADLEARGLLENAVVIVTSDHGESLGDHGQVGGHGGMFEEGLRVPLLVRLPGGARGGERVAEPVSLVDLVPTVLALVGAEPDPWLPGRSLLEAGGAAEAPPAAEDGRVLVAEMPPGRTLVLWPWKLVRNAARESAVAFRLDEDPDEARPMRGGSERFDELAAALDARRAAETAGRPAAPGEPLAVGELEPEQRERLRRLGYLGGDE